MALQNIFDIHSLTNQNRVVLQYTDENDLTTEILKIDATTYEEPVLELQPTSYPVLGGSDISDHIIQKPLTLTIRGIVSDHPINVAQSVVGGIGGIMGSVFDKASGAMLGLALTQSFKIGNRLTDTPARSKTAYEALSGLYYNKIPCDIITGLTPYRNMVMTRLSIPRDAKTANSLTFTAKFQEIKVVFSEKTTVPPQAINADQKATSKTKLGQKGTETFDQSTRASTWFNTIYDVSTGGN